MASAVHKGRLFANIGRLCSAFYKGSKHASDAHKPEHEHLQHTEMANDLSSRSLFLTVLEPGSLIVLNVLSLVGNILVCISVYRNTRLRTTTNLYIIALAVSDLLSAILVMPLITGVLITGRWPFGEKLCHVHAYFGVFAVYVSPVTMGLTALNRFVRICKSNQQYERFFSQTKSRVLLAVVWMFVALYLLALSSLSGLQEFRFHPGYALCLYAHLSKVGSIIHYFIVVGLFLLLPLGVTIFSYRKVYKRIREHNLGAGQALHTQAGNAAISSHEIRISRSLFVVVFAFMLCWLPLWVVNLLSRFRVVANMPRNVQLLCAFCLSLSNTINPFIYAGMNPVFRKEFKKILRCESARMDQYGIPQLQPSNEILNTVSARAQAETANNNSSEQTITRGIDNDSQDNEGAEVTAL